MKRFLLVIGAVALLFVGCGTTAGADNEVEFVFTKKDWFQDAHSYVYDVEDTKTKVHYIVISNGYNGIAITPKLNADGSLYIGE